MGNGKYKRLIPPIFIAILVLTLISLVSGSSWLAWELIQGVPIGNLAVGISLVTITGLNYKYLAKTAFSKRSSLVVLAFSAMWYPIGIIWSGNMRLSFTKNGEFWMPFSYVLLGVCMVSILLNIILGRLASNADASANSNIT